MTIPTTDRAAKQERLLAILDARGAEAIRLTQPETLAWYLDGARVSVPYGGPAVLTALVRRDGEVTVSAHANELERLRDEELAAPVWADLDFAAVPWHEPLPADGLLDTDVEDELRAARAALLPFELSRYAKLGADAAAALTRTLSAAVPGGTELGLAAELARAVVEVGAEPVVILVAGEARGGVPHPLPTRAPLGRRAMAVVGARRHGLIANATRWLAFGGAEAVEGAALREVEADAFAATRPGRELGEVLADIAAAYPRHGFPADAWQRHHQGGPAGYLGRDPKATPRSRDLVVVGQAFAWNPWVPGAKLEDTVVIDAAGVRVLTADPAWPTVPVRGVARPITLHLD